MIIRIMTFDPDREIITILLTNIVIVRGLYKDTHQVAIRMTLCAAL